MKNLFSLPRLGFHYYRLYLFGIVVGVTLIYFAFWKTLFIEDI